MRVTHAGDNSWVREGYKLINAGTGLKSLYSIEPDKIQNIPLKFIKWGVHSVGLKPLLEMDNGISKWQLTTDPWEKDYSNSFEYPLAENSQLEMVDLRKRSRPKFFGDLTHLYRTFEDMSCPIPLPVYKKFKMTNIVESHKLIKSKEFICEHVSGPQIRVLVNVFHSPYSGYRTSLSTFQHFRSGYSGQLICPVGSNPLPKKFIAGIKEILKPLEKKIYSVSMWVSLQRFGSMVYYISDVHYMDGEDFSLLPFEDRLKITQSVCSKNNLNGIQNLEKPKPDAEFAYYRHLDNRTYVDPTYISAPWRFVQFFCTDEIFVDGGKILELSVWDKDEKKFVKFSETFVRAPKRFPPKPTHKYLKTYKNHIVSVMCDTLVPGKNFVSYKTYPLLFKAYHADFLTLESIVSRY